MSDTLRYCDKVVIVTGGSQGIGKGIVRSFVENGAKVVFCAIGSDAGRSLEAELNGQGPGECLFTACDVTKEEEIQVKPSDHHVVPFPSLINMATTIKAGENAQLIGRMGTEAECGLAAVFLAADATFCTGVDLLLSGGAELNYGHKSQIG
uniref:Hydroxysteroid (17-beta) dehydrogenase 14 n=1 Tax=Paramormyrops kingsleyae TaxID=1676925 RepID=A0A3B3QHC0_9TELE